jgi:hypothetical protein
MIETRISETTFAPSDVKRYIGGAFDQRRLTWPEVAVLGSGRRRKLSFADSPYLLAILSPEFALTEGGLFLHGMPPHGIIDPTFARERGRFVSEGLNNHVHLVDFARSRVAQFEIGVRAIRQWIYSISSMRDRPGRVTIYLNGSTQFTICAYSEMSSSDLDQLDQRMGGKMVARSDEVFLAWAFPSSDPLRSLHA